MLLWKKKEVVNYYLAHHNKLYQHRTTQHVLPVKKMSTKLLASLETGTPLLSGAL